MTGHAERLATASGTHSFTGISASDDAFYAEPPEWIAKLSSMGILNVEMEASALYVVARLRGLRAGMVCACSSNLVDGASLYDEKNCGTQGRLDAQHRGGPRDRRGTRAVTRIVLDGGYIATVDAARHRAPPRPSS